MAIFDSNKVQNLTFYIVLPDMARVVELNAQYPNGFNAAPETAGNDYGAPWTADSAGHLPPYTYSPWPTGNDKPFPTNVHTFQRHTGGFLGIGGTTVRYYWIAKFQYMPDPVQGTGEGEPAIIWAPFPTRVFVEGFECPARGVLTGNVGELAITDASRHVGGRGLAIRGLSSATYGLTTSGVRLWERLYLRLRKRPTATVNFWRYTTTPSAGVGHVIGVTPDGGLALFTSSATNVLALVTVLPNVALEVWNGRPEHDVWVRLDVLYRVGTVGNNSIAVRVNGVQAYSGAGLNATAITSSVVGAPNQSAASDLELDLDDWHGAAWPEIAGTPADSKDLAYGTKIALVRPRAFTGGSGWTGDVRVLGQNSFAFVPAELTSSTSGALVQVETDGDDVITRDVGAAFGPCGLSVVAYSKRGSAASGSLGVKFGAAAAVDTASTQPSSLAGHTVTVSVAGGETDPPVITPLLLRHTKAADASAATIASLVAQVALAGKWTKADFSVRELEALGEGPGAEHPPGVDSDGVLTDPQVYFFSLIGKTVGEAAPDWAAVLTASAIPMGYGPGVVPTDNGFYGLTQQINADGPRGRLFLPTATPDGLNYYSHPIDLLAGSEGAFTWAWTDVGGPPYVAVSPGGASKHLNYGTGPHNTPYPRTPWAQRGLAAPTGTFIAHGGTYLGNGTGQDLLFRQPVHMLWLRPLTGGNGGALWFSSVIGSHTGHQGGVYPGVTFAEQDPTFVPADGEDVQQFRTRVRIAGGDADVNASGVTYQFIAVSDPSMRYLITGSMAHKDDQGPIDNPLPDATFTPQFLLLQAEQLTSTTTKRLYLKGPAQAAANLTNFAPAAPIAGLTFGQGKLTSDAPLHVLTVSQSYAVFRRSDGMQDTGEAGVVAFGSYIGDGSASRSIGLSPLSGKRPLFVLVYAETTGSGATRDPSHTGTTSTSHAGAALASTGITAGAIDGFSVGSALNTNGVTFGYFVLFAIADCTGNNGWGCNGEHIPTEPTSPGGGGPGGQGPGGGAWPPNPGPPLVPLVPVEPGGGGFPGGPPTNPPDFSIECAPWTTYLVNLALMRIGIGKQIEDIAVDVSEEAYKGRLIYAHTVEAVLRDFPWAFATRYASLVWVAGTAALPVNKDWLYAYRAPTGMVRARRLVGQLGQMRRYDHDPALFRLGTDSTGYLVYSNALATVDFPLQLEYTTRMTCPAQQGDPLFRDALVWKLAEGLALPLARDADKASYATQQYQIAILAAKEVAANEEQKDNIVGDAPWIRDR